MDNEEKIIKAMLYKTDGTRQSILLRPKNRLEQLQKLVGGYIEIVYIERHGKEGLDQGNDLVINEEGLIHDLPPNPFSSFVARNSIWQFETFRGDILLINGKLP